MDRIEIKSLAAVVCVALSACATHEARVEHEAVEFLPSGKVAIVVRHSEPAMTVKAHDPRLPAGGGNGPGTARAVLGGAAAGAFLPAYFLTPLGPIGWAVGLSLAPIGALAGAIVGMSKARPVAAPMQAQNEPSAEDALVLGEPVARALQARPLPQAVAMRIAALAGELPPYSVTYIGEWAEVPGTDLPEYRELRAAGFASIVEVAMTAIETRVISGPPPVEVALAASFRVRLLAPEPQEKVRTVELDEQGFWRSREQWADAEGRQLQEDIEEIVEQIARQSIAQAFDQYATE